MSGDMGDRGLALCKALGLDPSVVIADTCVIFREVDTKGNVRVWAEYRQTVNGAPERGVTGELFTRTIPLPFGLPMTAEPSVRDRAAEVLVGLLGSEQHAQACPRKHPDRSDSKGLGCDCWRMIHALRHVDALAAAGLLAGDVPVTVTHGCVKRAPTDNVTIESISAVINAGFILDAEPGEAS